MINNQKLWYYCGTIVTKIAIDHIVFIKYNNDMNYNFVLLENGGIYLWQRKEVMGKDRGRKETMALGNCL